MAASTSLGRSRSPASAIPSMRWSRRASRCAGPPERGPLPLQHHADIARHAAGIIEDLDADFEAQRLQLGIEELVRLLREALEGVRPIRLVVIDSATLVIVVV